jgi:drug/metabolite transporter (DMT)-like permease
MNNGVNSADAQGANYNDPVFRAVGISLALASGLFIGSSFIFKKKGLLQETNSGAVAGQGHSYLSNKLWWLGMILMIVGEFCNFVAYAFAQAIIVTPLGALSVVISAVLSSIFLKERLNLQGKIGCALCILGAVMIVIHSPDQQSANTIDEFSKLFFAPVFIVYTSLAIIISIIIIWKVAPTYGSKNASIYRHLFSDWFIVCSYDSRTWHCDSHFNHGQQPAHSLVFLCPPCLCRGNAFNGNQLS